MNALARVSLQLRMFKNNHSEPVFIIGGSRTGSEMLKTMLSVSDELDFVDEMFLLCPRWLHPDFQSNIAKHVGDFSADGSIDRVINLIFSGKLYGWFWSVADQKLNRDVLRDELSRDTLGLKSIFLAIMVTHARGNQKAGIGAKFPLHYSFTNRLLEWFPNCRLIHTTRNPKATYASQAAKYIGPNDGATAAWLMRCKQFLHINTQISWTARVHKRYKALPNYCLVRYEDVVLQPEAELRRICDFIGAEFLPAMLNPHQYGSSFDDIGAKRGVDRSSLERWRTSISPVTARAIDLLHPSAIKAFGYDR